MPRKQIKCCFYCDPERVKKLREISRKTYIPMSALMRLALDSIIAKYAK